MKLQPNKIEYPLFIDLNPSYVDAHELKRLRKHFRALPYYRGIDRFGRIWLGFRAPEDRNLTRDALKATLILKGGYLLEDTHEMADWLMKNRN